VRKSTLNREGLGGLISTKLLHEALEGDDIEEIEDLLKISVSHLMRNMLDLILLVRELAILSGIGVSDHQHILGKLKVLAHLDHVDLKLVVRIQVGH
jgi:hypothetical protein